MEKVAEKLDEKLNPDALEGAAGGCFFWHTFIGIQQVSYLDGTKFVKWECEDCGKLRYTKNGEEISEAEFNAAWNS